MSEEEKSINILQMFKAMNGKRVFIELTNGYKYRGKLSVGSILNSVKDEITGREMLFTLDSIKNITIMDPR